MEVAYILEQGFPNWGKFPPRRKFEAIRGEIVTLPTNNKKKKNSD